MNRDRSSVRWRRLLVEGSVLVVSIYLAIVLEGVSEERADHREAVEALLSLKHELDLDRRDLDVVMGAQAERFPRHDRIDRWLADPSTAPLDSLGQDIARLFRQNRTMFPRDAAWTTMVSSSQLADLRDARLVARLADFYENRNERLAVNADIYDEWVSGTARNVIPVIWDQSSSRFLTSDEVEVARVRGQMAGLRDFSEAFFALLDQWRVELESLQSDVDRYLERSSGGRSLP